MTVLDAKACYLPGLAAADTATHTLSFVKGTTTLNVQVPVLNTSQWDALAERVRQGSRSALKTLPSSRIVDVVAKASARLLNPQDPCRIEAEKLLPIVSGFHPEMIRLALTDCLTRFRRPQLERFLAEDFANPKLLDGFQPRPKGGWAQAVGPDLLVHVWAGNVPGLPLWSLISGLLVKAGSIGKVSSAEPLMATWFARLLVEVEPKLADSLAVVWWPGSDADTARQVFQQADVVMAYGGDAALAGVRQQVPAATRFLPHGHKISFGMVSASALDARQGVHTARLAAWDLVSYEQQGCYSPHVFYVEQGGKVTPQEFANYLASELAALHNTVPRHDLSLEEGVSVARWRQAREFATQGGGESAVLSDVASPWCVYFSGVPLVLVPSALNRTVSVVAVPALDDVVALVEPQRRWLQTAGLAASPEELFRLSTLLGRAGVTRICAIGAMASPEAGWHHDGRFSLLDLVQMVEIEQSAELAAETFSAYRN